MRSIPCILSSDRSIFDLENSVDLARLSEPLTALEHLRGLIVIDEVQRRPDLFRVLRVLLDRKPLRACEALELCKRMHNPKAEVVYDAVAGREGGAKLYSQIAPLFTDTQNSDYAPTQAQLGQMEENLADLAVVEQELTTLRDGDLAQLEAQAKALGLPRVIAPERSKT